MLTSLASGSASRACILLATIITTTFVQRAADAQLQTSEQSKCLTALAAAAAKVAAAQQKAAALCLKQASRADLPTGQTADACLEADNGGKLAKVQTKTLAIATDRCVTSPDFGGHDGTAANATAVLNGLALFRDAFGTNLDVSAITVAHDEVGADCQAAVAKGTAKLLTLFLKEINSCQKAGLKDGTITNVAGLAACVSNMTLDPKGKLAKSVAKLSDTVNEVCAGVDRSTAFPGACSASPDFAQCLAKVARCETCQLANGIHSLAADCDMVDDSSANGSCCDADHDGFAALGCASGNDCDDADPLRNPGAAEACNMIDDDCDTFVDEATPGAGMSCGTLTVAPCSTGTLQCSAGSMSCQGEIEPSTETCNGIDDDCDGSVDLAAGAPPTDAVGTCNVRPTPPAGATSPCVAGTKTCSGGIVGCTGSVSPTQSADACGVDANCDGLLTNQPDVQSDVSNCGSCGHSCLVGTLHSQWTCTSGACEFRGCQPGYYDLDGNQTCEYPCSFTSAQEACNGLDDDCDGLVDEGLTPPAPTSVCGVSPAAASPQCTSQVSVTCTSGTWSCSFPSGYCTGGNCAATADTCDGNDNDCDGGVDENNVCGSCVASPEVCDGCDNDCDGVADNGAAAVSCGLPAPANCAGLQACKPPQAVTVGGCAPFNAGLGTCSASPTSETCDSQDNDCDGQIDEGIAPTTCLADDAPMGIQFGPTSQCRRGQRSCGQACIGYVGPSSEVCDGIDNNCDGIVDNGAAGVGMACGVNGHGCTSGVTACVNGAIVCQGGTGPQPEICDGVDNDCDGDIDDPPLADGPSAGNTGCWALPGNCCSHAGLRWCPPAGASCNGAGSLTTPCAAGALTCTGGAWTCQHSTSPSAEACDGLDNDCNGSADDGGGLCPSGLSCTGATCR